MPLATFLWTVGFTTAFWVIAYATVQIVKINEEARDG
jgi:hypothetical protein